MMPIDDHGDDETDHRVTPRSGSGTSRCGWSPQGLPRMAEPHSSRGVLDSGHDFGNTHAVERIRNGWRLAKASWAVLSQDRELVAIPIIAGIISLVVFAVVAVPGVALLGGGDDDAVGWATWLVLAHRRVAGHVGVGHRPGGGRVGRRAAHGRHRPVARDRVRRRQDADRPPARVGGARHGRRRRPRRPSRSARHLRQHPRLARQHGVQRAVVPGAARHRVRERRGHRRVQAVVAAAAGHVGRAADVHVRHRRDRVPRLAARASASWSARWPPASPPCR